MNRPRKTNKHLPRGVYLKHGAYYHVTAGKWHRLSDDLATALHEYGRRVSTSTGTMPLLINRAMPAILKDKAANTKTQYDQAADILRRKLAEFNPNQVLPKHVAALKASMADTPNMANRVLSVLRMVFAQALEWQEVDSNPCIGIGRYDEARRKRFVTDAEYAAIYAKANPQTRLVMDFLYLTGQRIGDVLAIRHTDLTPNGIMFTTEKTGARLMVARSAELDAAIESAKGMRGNVRGMTLLCGRGGKPLDYKSIYEQFKRAAVLAGVPDVTPHDLRAKSLTATKKQGKDSKALGAHSSEAMNARYIRQHDIPVVQGPSFRQSKDA